MLKAQQVASATKAVERPSREGLRREAAAARASAARQRNLLNLALPGLFVLVGMGLWESFRDNQAYRSILAAEEAVSATSQLFAAVSAAESGEREFLLTSSESFLEPYREAVYAVPGALKRFREAVNSLPVDGAKADMVERLARQRMEELDESLRQRREKGSDPGRDFVTAGNGNKLMQDLRMVARTLESEYMAYERLEQKNSDRMKMLALSVTALGSIVAAIVLVLAGRQLRSAQARQYELAMRMSEREQQYQRLSDRLQMIREEERAHLAREIHDVLGQSLTGIKLDIGSGLRRIESGDKQSAREKLQQGLAVVDETIRLLRRIASELRPPLLDHVGLAAAIKTYCNEFSERSGVAFELDLKSERMQLTPDERIALFRIFQESLTNIARHACTKTARVILQEQDETIVLRIEDSGIGFEMHAVKESLGLLGMQERARLVGAQFSINSAPNAGTVVEVSLRRREV